MPIIVAFQVLVDVKEVAECSRLVSESTSLAYQPAASPGPKFPLPVACC